jgi:hypothetical protein
MSFVLTAGGKFVPTDENQNTQEHGNMHLNLVATAIS